MSFYFACRLAYRQLFYERSKTLTALLGVMFACVLVFMQLGFRDSLFRSAANLPRQLNGDLFVIHRQNTAIWQGYPFDTHYLARLYGHPNVAHFSSVLLSPAKWKNPLSRETTTILIIGINPNHCVLKGLGASRRVQELNMRNTLVFDALSKPEFGPISELLKQQKIVDIEINGVHTRVIETFDMGASFAATGNAVVSHNTFYNLFPDMHKNSTHIGVLTLKQKDHILKTQQELTDLCSPMVRILRWEELIQHEENYWRKRTSIGFTFGMGVAIGLIVGMVIVYQILFTDVKNSIAEYATLRAMGYSQRYLGYVVISSALWLAILGFIPGVLAARALYYLTESVTRLPMLLPLDTILSVWILIFSMCAVAGLLAVRQLKHADPAGLF